MTRKSKAIQKAGGRREYRHLLGQVVGLLESARSASARAVNLFMTATYWQIGKRIVESEQKGSPRALYGEELLERLATDLAARFGRGFSRRNLSNMRLLYLWRPIWQTPSAKSLPSPASPIWQTSSAKSPPLSQFPLPWSHYVRLLSVKSDPARSFYESEALRGGWSIKQLDRQISTLFYERTALSKNKSIVLVKGRKPRPGDNLPIEAHMKDSFVLEFLGLKDEYSESDLEEALIHHLESFLLELGDDFAFVGRQRRLRIGNQWFRIDLLFFHRRLKCLVVIDLKLGHLTAEDVGQMHLYLNFAREQWLRPDEQPPVGLILCSEKDDAVARYTLDNLPNKILATEYRMKLPNEKLLVKEIERTRESLELCAATRDHARQKILTRR